MQKKSLIKQNILQFIDFKGISKYKFYKETGITRSVLDKNSGLSEENTAKFIARYSEVNPIWLLTGKGEMIKSNQNSLNQSIMGNENYMAGKDIFLNKENEALIEEIKGLKNQIAEKDLIIKTLVEQQKKLINKL